MIRRLSLAALVLGLIPAVAMAVPKTTSTGALLAQAESRGYNFELDDLTIEHKPKFVSEARVVVRLHLKNILKDNQPVPVADDRNDPNRIAGVIKQFDNLCQDMFLPKDAQLPRLTVDNTSYSYFNFKVFSMTCTIELPSAD